MFSADLSWTDPDTEKVGERKERIAKEKEKERSTSSAAGSVCSNNSRSSIPDDRELWWTSSLKKAKNFKPSRPNRPDSARSVGHTRKTSGSLPITLEIDTSVRQQFQNFRDPILQPAWTYTTSLSPTLPSGAPLDPPEYEVPELEGDLSSRGTDSSGSHSSHERRSPWKSLGRLGVNVIDEVREFQQLSPHSYVARTTRLSSEDAETQPEGGPQASLQDKKKKKKLYSVRIEGGIELESLQLQDAPVALAPAPTKRISTEKGPSYASGLGNNDLVAWRPPSEWDIVLPSSNTPDLDPYRKSYQSMPGDEGHLIHQSPIELTRFQRFIRRMESAGPKIILDRLKEEWHSPVDVEAEEEMILEKELWILTAFQLQNLGRYSRFPLTNTGKILELYGSLSEVFQLSAMHPKQKVHYLTNKPQQQIQLPANVTYMNVPQEGVAPLPYPDNTFSHIRASTLPSLVPSSQLPQIFQECYRLLAPGGMLEIRVMDAAPVRKTAGPKMKAWVEDRLADNLERLFRCSKPCALVPGWVSDAGFDLPTSPSEEEEMVKMRPAFDKKKPDIDRELSALVCRAMWRDIWGDFVDVEDGEPRWWWEDEEVMKECIERETVFECGAIFAFKN